MTAATWPNWFSWLLAIAILLTLFFVWSLLGQVASLRRALNQAGMGPFRSRKELEEAYAAGAVSREAYERLRGEFS